MRDHLEFISRFGVEFANVMSQKILTESNSKTATGQAYKLPDALRTELVARVAIWKEAIILYEHLKTVQVNVPYGLKELPKVENEK